MELRGAFPRVLTHGLTFHLSLEVVAQPRDLFLLFLLGRSFMSEADNPTPRSLHRYTTQSLRFTQASRPGPTMGLGSSSQEPPQQAAKTRPAPWKRLPPWHEPHVI